MNHTLETQLAAQFHDSPESPGLAVHPILLNELQVPPAPTGAPAAADNPIHHVKARLQACLGEAVMTVGELLAAREHQVVVLDRHVEQPVDLLIEGKVIARGQIVAVGDNFAVRITELPAPLKP